MQTKVVSQLGAEVRSWSTLSTVTSFDAGSTLAVGMMDNGLALQGISHFTPVSLLIQSLVKQLCKLLGNTPGQQQKLYTAICHKLHQMNLIDQSYNVEEFEFMRSHYQKALFHLLSVAKSVTDASENETNVLLQFPRYNIGISDSPFTCDWSRYSTEYEQLEFIARGGFGRVYKVRNKLDGVEYAVKKICLQYHSITGFLLSLREVKMLAKLNHPNIVSYKAAWLEPMTITPSSQVAEEDGSDKSDNMFLHTHAAGESRKFCHHSTEDSGSIVFKRSASRERTGLGDSSASVSTGNPNEDNNNQEVIASDCNENVCTVSQQYKAVSATQSYRHVRCSSGYQGQTSADTLCMKKQVCQRKIINIKTSNEFTSSTDESNVSVNKVMMKYQEARQIANLTKTENPSIHCESAMLYVQMQLCERTLRQWLDIRNAEEPTVVDMKQNVAIFQQIVSGVCYIHSQSIVHHDIKPSNIFVNHNLSQVQVGDFGLACCLQHCSDDVTLMMQPSSEHPLKHKGEIGTKLYAAPEQLKGKCDSKSDMYSLGIILFELLQPFSTDMERCKLITRLRTGHVPPELAMTAPKLAQLIGRLVSSSPADRPSADELQLMLVPLIKETNDIAECVDSKNKTIQHLLAVIKKQDRELEELRQKLQELQTITAGK
ncbi:Eukaryotic translation initiation factor 2-alpha kinase 1 [Cryptotermes secundus]|uniref:non-specific serine/threonine protein kinase n=3 Tax=Cryptotermes secundus TaxID=105785 RepID=A0A2J7Q4F1_9NEOP|nr:eukaryotic translation initiation factor 2-alpha kinase 1 isoform X2 [Cryptotermes secundus]PNF23464.1 Eukaryotic translation initiation factor 2-alpha kinase 1 [Cryptotermes secundus]PNF23468.1 Eukaryotic translation initiation factor 2-alpha kinase 1 [Cryptotermes secundus]